MYYCKEAYSVSLDAPGGRTTRSASQREILTSSMVMPFWRSVMILVIPDARYSHVSPMLSRSGPLGMPAARMVVVVEPLGIMKGGDSVVETMVR